MKYYNLYIFDINSLKFMYRIFYLFQSKGQYKKNIILRKTLIVFYLLPKFSVDRLSSLKMKVFSRQLLGNYLFL